MGVGVGGLAIHWGAAHLYAHLPTVGVMIAKIAIAIAIAIVVLDHNISGLGARFEAGVVYSA